MRYNYESLYYENKTLPRRFLDKLDWMLFGIVIALVLIGLMAVYSATLHYGNPGKFFGTQSLAIAIGFVGLVFFLMFDYQYYGQMVYFIYTMSLLMLGLVLAIGNSVRGTKGWFDLGYFSFQPVEFAKIMFILVLAGYLDRHWRSIKHLSALFVPIFLLLGHAVLILMQPDFSSILVYFPITFVLLYVVGSEPLYLWGAVFFGGLAVGIPIMSTYFQMQPALLKAHSILNFVVAATRGGWQAVVVLICLLILIYVLWWFLNQFRVYIPPLYLIVLSGIVILGCISSVAVQKSLKRYQRKRLVVFLNPEIDPLGAGYNIMQSKIAIGSGRIKGKGLFSGTQSQLGFLPDQHTDYIFSVLGEETGYLFSQFTIFLYFLLVWRAMIVARDARDRYGSLVAAGIAGMFAFYGLINIGMVMGLMPATGLPLPFISYGGSSMVSSLCAIGILFSIQIRRYTH